MASSADQALCDASSGPHPLEGRDDPDTAMRRIRTLAYAILDGTLIPIDGVLGFGHFARFGRLRLSVTAAAQPNPFSTAS